MIGGEVVEYFITRGYKIFGIDNNMREIFFWEQWKYKKNLERLKSNYDNYTHFNIDIRNRVEIDELIKALILSQ